MPVSPDEITRQYADAVLEAKIAYQSAAERLNSIQSQYDALPSDIQPGTPEETASKQLESRLKELEQTYRSAQQNYVDTLHQRADAINKAKSDADPAQVARLQAQADADTARAKQIQAEADEYLATAPDRRAAASQDVRLKTAQADQAEYNLALAKETDPQRRAAAQADLDRAAAETERIRKETSQIGKPAPQTPEAQRTAAAQAATAEANAAVAPTVAQATATTAQAQAGTAQGQAEAALATAQANAKKAQVDLEDAQRRARQSPTDAQAQAAIDAAQKAADLANQQLEQAIKQAGNLNPVLVQQAQATLDATRANTLKNVLGDLAGRRDQLEQIKSLVAAGEISPAEADGMAAALNRGTTVYQAQSQRNQDILQGRQQDVSNRNQLASTFGSTFNSGFSTLADLNKYATPGSTAGADAFVALLNMAQDRLKNYQLPPAQTTDYLAPAGGSSPMSGLINQAQQTVAAAPAPVPSAPATGHAITINIGGAETAPSQPYETSAQSVQRNMAAPSNALGGLVGQAAKSVMATPQDIYDAYGVHPSLREA